MDGKGQREQRACRGEQANPRQKLTPLPTRFCSKVYPAQPSIAIVTSKSPIATPEPKVPCPLVMITAAPTSESSMPMIWFRWMASWPETKENSSTTSGASAMIRERLIAEVVTPAT